MPVVDEVVQYGATLDFQDRPNYRPALLAVAEELDRIVGKYERPAPQDRWLSCGLNGCDQPHRRGYVLRLTSGLETHCGNECGQRHFGVKWEELEATAKATETAAATRAAVANFMAERDALLARAASVSQRCGELESRVSAFESALSDTGSYSLQRLIQQCAREGGSIRIAAEEQGQAQKYGRRRSNLRTIAILEGVGLLTPGYTRYSSVIRQLMAPVRDLDASTLDQLTIKQLAQHSRSAQAFATTLDRAERQLQDGDHLFAPGNREKIEHIVAHQLSSRDITPRLRAALEEGAWRSSRRSGEAFPLPRSRAHSRQVAHRQAPRAGVASKRCPASPVR